VLGSKKSNDLSHKIFTRKRRVFSKIENLTVVGLSRWLAEEARSSTLFASRRVVNLPNPIDTNVFAPYKQSLARELLCLPKDKKLVCFGAMSASDPRKGFKELSAALSMLDHNDIELMVFGGSQPKEPQGFRNKAYYLGQLHDDVSLRVLYSAADVMVVPSLQDNLSNVIMEALACGIPVVGYQIGGNPDMIDHKINGYLAKPFYPKDLARGIEWVLENSDRSVSSNFNREQAANFSFLPEIGRNAREKVMREFDSQVVTIRYLQLYEEILSTK
jgi:glycosyltransferase involved in cell wall biosynthesis